MPTVNAHFVSRFLTKPWEFGDRRLRYVDLRDRSVKVQSSRSLFAIEGGMESELEDGFNQRIEQPVVEWRERLLAGKLSPKKIEDWKLFRALHLLLRLQPARRRRIVDSDIRSGTELLLESESVLDALVARWDQEYSVAWICAKPEEPLFVPDTGEVAFWVPDEGCATGWTLAFGIPVHPRIMLAIVSKSVDEHGLAFLRDQNLQACSVGFAPDLRRVVVPADGEPQGGADLPTIVEDARARNQLIVESVIALRAKVTEAWTSLGFKVADRKPGNPVGKVWPR